ncbi:hypothetical protein PIB30_004805 [Stylosanthes scabra]|uniref:GRF-type domain-containing protein n=1 Tax=Stylosanthes scabra TaxID=79078 RepID=A0ABU6T3P1_9FABA|nr:hypothetical protein [Stylosanthes scabra]
MASSSKERWSGSNRDSGRDGGDGEGWSFSKASTQSGGASKKKSKFVAPECNCGAFAILFMSSTGENPNRLFYGCPYFKVMFLFKYFDWLDEYVVKCDAQTSKAAYLGATKQVNGSFCGAYQFELKCRELEDRLIGLESHSSENKHVKSDLKCTSISCLVLGFVTGIAIASMIRVLG